MFAIAFILYRITTCFKRIMTNAGAKLQNKYEIFLRSTEKFGADENFRGNLMILNEAKVLQVLQAHLHTYISLDLQMISRRLL